MQKRFIGLLGTTTLALAVLCAVQWRQLRVANERLHVAKEARRMESEAREAQSANAKELERTTQRLEQQVKEFTMVTTSLRASETSQASNLTVMTKQLRSASPEGEPKAGLFGKEMGDMLGKMMKDPSMREMMRSQQKAAINMMYGGLLKEMKLSPDEKEKLMGILTEAQMKNIENAQGMFGGEKEDETQDTQKLLEEAKKQSDAAIKELLGEERFTQFRDYQKNITERMQLDQLQTRLEGENLPLQESQKAQLLQAMKEERAAVPPVIPSDATQLPKDLKGLMTAENVDKQLEWMDGYNRRVLDRAAQFLTPEQLQSYRDYQEQQSALQKMGLKMAKEMFGSGKNAGAAPAK
jgi:hypothetical protein